MASGKTKTTALDAEEKHSEGEETVASEEEWVEIDVRKREARYWKVKKERKDNDKPADSAPSPTLTRENSDAPDREGQGIILQACKAQHNVPDQLESEVRLQTSVHEGRATERVHHEGVCGFKTESALSRKKSSGDHDEELKDNVADTKKLQLKGDFGDFVEVRGQICIGRTANVYRGKHIPTQEAVAIKEMMRYGKWSAFIQREVDPLRQLQHKNIVKLKAVYGSVNSVALVMELLAVDLLRLLIDSLFTLEENMEMAIMYEILQGLDYLHRQDIVHCDIKPENILIGAFPGVEVKITDFGLGFRTEAQPCDLRGTRPHIAPEMFYNYFLSIGKLRPSGQLRLSSIFRSANGNPMQLGPPCDMWGLGITMVIMATKTRPFWHLELQRYRQLMVSLEMFQLEEQLKIENKPRSHGWLEVVGRCLVMDPKFRWEAQTLLRHPQLRERADLEVLRPRVEDAAYKGLGPYSQRRFIGDLF